MTQKNHEGIYQKLQKRYDRVAFGSLLIIAGVLVAVGIPEDWNSLRVFAGILVMYVGGLLVLGSFIKPIIDENPATSAQLGTPQGEVPVPETNAFTSVLEFYNSELTSHAGIILSLVLAGLALIQAFPALRTLSPRSEWWFGVALGGLASGVVYAGIRLIVYGHLARAIMHGTREEFQTAARKAGFLRLLPHAQVNTFSIHYFNGLKFAKHFYSIRRPANLLIAIAIWLAFFLYFAGR